MRRLVFAILVLFAVVASSQEEGDRFYNNHEVKQCLGPDTVGFRPTFYPVWRYDVCFMLVTNVVDADLDSCMVTMHLSNGDTVAIKPQAAITLQRTMHIPFFGPDVDSFTIYSFGTSRVKIDAWK